MSNSKQDNLETDKDLANLLTDAGARPLPSMSAQQAAYRALREDWQDKVQEHRQQRSRRRTSVLSAAAAVVLTVMAGLLWVPQAESQWQLQLASGELFVDGVLMEDIGNLVLEGNETLEASTAVRLSTPVGADLRLAAGSVMQWQDAENLQLSSGSLYIDTKERSDFNVQTAFGVVRDIGTRYMVSTDAETMHVAVREGAAEVDSTFGRYIAEAQPLQAAVLEVTAVGVAERVETTADSRWDWIHQVSSGYSERPVPALLDAIGRDLGKQVSYASRGVEATVTNTTVTGELEGLSPRDALHLVAQSAGLQWQEQANHIVVDFNSNQ
jgi:ferric-dicitrate binding protein FerR (iron transport regulator)